MERILGTLFWFIGWCVAIVMDIARHYPAVVIQACVLLLHATWMNTLLLAGSLILSVSLRYAGSGECFRRSNMRAKVFLGEFFDGQLEVLPLEALKQLLPEFYINRPNRGLSWWRNPSKLTVCVVRPSQSGCSLRAISSFKSLSNSSYIFLPDHPRNFTIYQKFCFLREIDHVSIPSRVLDRTAQQNVLFWTFPWISLLANWSLQNAIALTLMFVAYPVLFVSSEFGTETEADAITREQADADHRALTGLTEAERTRLDEILDEYPLDNPEGHNAEALVEPLSSGFVSPSYLTSLEPSAAFRNFALRQAIAVSLDSSKAVRTPAPAIPHALLVEGIRLAIILLSGYAIAVLGQTATPWRLWAAAALTGWTLVGVIVPWHYVFRSRRKIAASIAEYSAA